MRGASFCFELIQKNPAVLGGRPGMDKREVNKEVSYEKFKVE